MNQKQRPQHKGQGQKNTTNIQPDYSADIRSTVEKYPYLEPDGWNDFYVGRGTIHPEDLVAARLRMFTPDFEHQVKTAIEAIHSCPDILKMRNKKNSSYRLKHIVENWVASTRNQYRATHITNGAFITAAIISGWLPVRRGILGRNCSFVGVK